ncbi:uncharacterized protein LOC118488300 [Helianthus annuus]|uniref:uncharacterized protein LOC118488300 n=1 Tax=Helianthus annuus TaxID=4232 RepID=UPI0016533101|nr:uncharacterized protein LOC118488300 [Helianthus annuus]
MTSFLNKGLQHLLHLYNDACGTVALHEARIKQLETTVADQGAIAEAKSRHYEDKLKKVTQDAELKLATMQMDHDQAMINFREGIKTSAIVSLLQARIKMAYEAKETGLVCPSWPIESWVAKLKELGGKAVPLPSEADQVQKTKPYRVIPSSPVNNSRLPPSVVPPTTTLAHCRRLLPTPVAHRRRPPITTTIVDCRRQTTRGVLWLKKQVENVMQMVIDGCSVEIVAVVNDGLDDGGSRR